MFHFKDKLVYTPHGTGKVIAEFKDSTLCVRLDSTESGIILFASEVFLRTDPQEIRELSSSQEQLLLVG